MGVERAFRPVVVDELAGAGDQRLVFLAAGMAPMPNFIGATFVGATSFMTGL